MTSADIAVSQNGSLNIYGQIHHCESESANSSWVKEFQIMINLGEKGIYEYFNYSSSFSPFQHDCCFPVVAALIGS